MSKTMITRGQAGTIADLKNIVLGMRSLDIINPGIEIFSVIDEPNRPTNTIIKVIEKPPKPSKWHMESDHPDNNRSVMVYISDTDFDFARWSGHGWQYEMLPERTGRVTHWREKPKPPKKGE
jgi:hypothetical protein